MSAPPTPPLRPLLANTNCLAGVFCPNCKQEDQFEIQATATFEVTDNGTDCGREVAWEDEAWTRCTECGHTATYREFFHG